MGNLWRFLVIATLALLCIGCGPENNVSNDGKSNLLPPVSSSEVEVPIVLYRLSSQGDKLVKTTVKVKIEDNKVNTLIKTLLKDVGDEKYPNMFAKYNVKLIGVSIGPKGVATVNLTKELKQIKTGSMTEMLLVYSIVNTLTEIPEVNSVNFAVEGKPIGTFNGHMDLTEPLKKDLSLVAPDK